MECTIGSMIYPLVWAVPLWIPKVGGASGCSTDLPAWIKNIINFKVRVNLRKLENTMTIVPSASVLTW